MNTFCEGKDNRKKRKTSTLLVFRKNEYSRTRFFERKEYSRTRF